MRAEFLRFSGVVLVYIVIRDKFSMSDLTTLGVKGVALAIEVSPQ